MISSQTTHNLEEGSNLPTGQDALIERDKPRDDGPLPKYLEVADRILQGVRSMPTGTQLPPLRSLSKHYQVSLSTALAAIAHLEERNMLRRDHGRGVFVERAASTHHIRFFHSNFPSHHVELKTSGMRLGCLERGWHFSTRVVEAARPDLPQNYLKNNPDGVIIASDVLETHPELHQAALAKKIPVVVLGREAGRQRIDSVTGDDFHGMTLLMRHLHGLGHRRIALLISEPEVYEIRQREERFRSLAKAFDLPEPKVFNFHIPYGQQAIEVVAQNFRRLLREDPRLDFTAIIACSDPGAMALLRVFHEFDIQVPEDCSVAGFDDELFANYLTPSLTNLCWHMENWGEKCLEVLEKIYERKDAEFQEIKIQPSLNRRESTARPAPDKGRRK